MGEDEMTMRSLGPIATLSSPDAMRVSALMGSP